MLAKFLRRESPEVSLKVENDFRQKGMGGAQKRRGRLFLEVVELSLAPGEREDILEKVGEVGANGQEEFRSGKSLKGDQGFGDAEVLSVCMGACFLKLVGRDLPVSLQICAQGLIGKEGVGADVDQFAMVDEKLASESVGGDLDQGIAGDPSGGEEEVGGIMTGKLPTLKGMGLMGKKGCPVGIVVLNGKGDGSGNTLAEISEGVGGGLGVMEVIGKAKFFGKSGEEFLDLVEIVEKLESEPGLGLVNGASEKDDGLGLVRAVDLDGDLFHQGGPRVGFDHDGAETLEEIEVFLDRRGRAIFEAKLWGVGGGVEADLFSSLPKFGDHLLKKRGHLGRVEDFEAVIDDPGEGGEDLTADM